jgi:hypothetical protein
VPAQKRKKRALYKSKENTSVKHTLITLNLLLKQPKRGTPPTKRGKPKQTELGEQQKEKN